MLKQIPFSFICSRKYEQNSCCKTWTNEFEFYYECCIIKAKDLSIAQERNVILHISHHQWDIFSKQAFKETNTFSFFTMTHKVAPQIAVVSRKWDVFWLDGLFQMKVTMFKTASILYERLSKAKIKYDGMIGWRL